MQKAESGQKWILVAGRKATDDEGFEQACQEIGATLAEAGLGVMVGSFDEDTADIGALRGVLRVDARLARVMQPASRYEVPGEFRDVVVAEFKEDWQAVRQMQLKAAHAVLLIGGRDGARELFANSKKPVLAVSAFGGAAQELFSQVSERLRRNVEPDALQRLQSWTSATPTTIAALLYRLLGIERANAYLLTWDPGRTVFRSFARTAETIGTDGGGRLTWSASPLIEPSDRVYLMRHDGDDAGLVGVGKAIAPTAVGPHWDPEARARGYYAWFASIEWEALQERPIIPLDELISGTRERSLWTRHGNGHPIPWELRDKLDALIARRLRKPTPKPQAPESSASDIGLHAFAMSPDVRRVITRAHALAVEHQRRSDARVTSPLLLAAALREESDPEAAWSWLRQTLSKSSTATVGENILDESLASSGRHADGRSSAWSASALDFMEHAQDYARRTTHAETIEAGHLIAAIIRRSFVPEASTGAGSVFTAYSLDEPTLCTAFLEWLERSGHYQRGDDRGAWQRIFGRDAEPAANGRAMPHLALESPRGVDLLKIDRDVEPLAAVIAAQTLEPPLAVGLFGDWGSGKSFFMEKLRDRIDLLAKASREREQNKKPYAFHGEVAQIWFNAWNYVETNLWASLVTHIFESLHQRFAPSDSADEQKWSKLLEQLDRESALGQEMQDELKVAEKRLRDAQEDRKQKMQRAGAAVVAFWGHLTAKIAKDTPGATKLEDLLPADELREVRDGLVLRREEARDLVARLDLNKRVFISSLTKAHALGPFAVVFITGAAAIVVAQLSTNQPVLKAIGEQVGAVVALVGSASTWVGAALRRANKVVVAVGEAAHTLHDSLVAGELDDSELLAAEREMHAAAKKVEEQEARIDALRSSINELQPSRRLTSFLASRAESQDYRKHLGLPAMIRRDFEHLQNLMRQMKVSSVRISEAAARVAADSTVPAELVKELREKRIYLPKETKVKAGGLVHDDALDYQIQIRADGECVITWNRLRIDRIVLYIDDLDRCPSERVVEVLQAVRLLLDFDLFVVVVGVDARWVTQALKTHHRRQFRSAGSGFADAPEPQDFLEKIFQIPLWLEPLEPNAARDYIKGLTEKSVRVTKPSATHEPAKRVDHASAPRLSTPRLSAPPAQLLPAQQQQQQPQPKPTAVAQPTAAVIAKPATVVSDDQPDSVMNPPGLELDPWEQAFMLKLSGLIVRSPRAVKRFVNVYRLIRSGIPEDQLPAFRGTEHSVGAYQVVQVLLAVIVGRPAIAEALFDRMRASSSPVALRATVGELLKSEADEEKREEWQALASFLEPTQGATIFAGDEYLVPAWYERVSRYSFRVGRR